MDKYTETQATLATFEQEVRLILESDDRVRHVEYDGQHTWILRLRCHDRDDAETARLEIVDDLIETLGEEVCDGLAFSSKVSCAGTSSRIELQIVDEDDLGESDGDEGCARSHETITPNRWRGTSPDGRTVDDVGTNVVEIQRHFDHEVRECCRQFARCLGLTEEGSADCLRGTLEEYLASTDRKGYPEGLSAWLEGLETGTIKSLG